MSFCLSTYITTYLSIHLSMYLPIIVGIIRQVRGTYIATILNRNCAKKIKSNKYQLQNTCRCVVGNILVWVYYVSDQMSLSRIQPSTLHLPWKSIFISLGRLQVGESLPNSGMLLLSSIMLHGLEALFLANGKTKLASLECVIDVNN